MLRDGGLAVGQDGDFALVLVEFVALGFKVEDCSGDKGGRWLVEVELIWRIGKVVCGGWDEKEVSMLCTYLSCAVTRLGELPIVTMTCDDGVYVPYGWVRCGKVRMGAIWD